MSLELKHLSGRRFKLHPSFVRFEAQRDCMRYSIARISGTSSQLGGRRWRVKRGLWQKRRVQMLIQQTTDLVDLSTRAQQEIIIDDEASHARL